LLRLNPNRLRQPDPITLPACAVVGSERLDEPIGAQSATIPYLLFAEIVGRSCKLPMLVWLNVSVVGLITPLTHQGSVGLAT